MHEKTLTQNLIIFSERLSGLCPQPILMFHKVDCIRVHVPSIESALKFYRDELGLELVWRRGSSEAGLKMGNSDTELVLVTKNLKGAEVDILVKSADLAAGTFEELGGNVVVPHFDIAVGRCAVVQDPWKNSFVVLDMSKGRLKTNSKGDVIE